MFQEGKPVEGPDHVRYTKLETIHNFLKDKNNYLWALFLDAVIPNFEHTNLLLQRDEPCIHILLSALRRLLETLLSSYIDPSGLVDRDILEVETDNKCLKSDEDLFIGAAAREYISENSEDLQLD